MKRGSDLIEFKKSLEKKSMAELRDMFNAIKAEQDKAVIVEDEMYIRGLRKNFLGREQI